MPQPGPRLASTILFFLQALNAGNFGGWLGGTAGEMLERAGRGDLTGRLAQDFAQLARLSDTAGGEWRFLPLPFYDGQELHQLRLFLRSRHGNGDGPGPEAGQTGEDATRFVLDVDNSRFGELQLDGLVRAQRFDLILRSRRALPEVMRHDIAGIFAQANGITGSAGQIGFQASPDWQALPLAPDAPETHIAPGLVV